MRISRTAVVVVGASVAVALVSIASCGIEADLFTVLPDADVAPPIDSSRPDLGADTTLDTTPSDVDPFDGGLDGAWIHCYPDACHLTTDECCVWSSLDPYCTPIGTCGEAGLGRVECDRASMCDAGRLCCAHPSAFGFYGKCDPSCASNQLCESNRECVDGGHCFEGGVFNTCVWD